MTLQNNQADITIPASVLRLLAAVIGAPAEAIAPTFGGFSNLSFFATFAGVRCVVKAAALPIKREDVRREVTVLAALAETSIPVPILLHVVEDSNWTIAVTQAHTGRNGLRVLAETPAELAPLFAALGSALGRVHATQLRQRVASSLTRSVEQSRVLLLTMPIEDELRGLLAASLRHPIWQTEAPRLVHGDIGLHNIVWDGNLLLLDWEWAHVGQPLLDLAWLRWTLRWRALDQALWHAALHNYQQVAGVLPSIHGEAIQALMLGQIAMILARVRDQPTASAEWLRRASWTLALTDEDIRFV